MTTTWWQEFKDNKENFHAETSWITKEELIYFACESKIYFIKVISNSALLSGLGFFSEKTTPLVNISVPFD